MNLWVVNVDQFAQQLDVAHRVTTTFRYRDNVVILNSLAAVTLNALALVSAPDHDAYILRNRLYFLDCVL